MGIRGRSVLLWAALAALSSCGGGGGDGDIAGSSLCTAEAQKKWLAGYMNTDRWYLWTDASPQPAPDANPQLTLAQYLDALRFQGDGAVPADHWSYIESAAQFGQFFGEGKTMGYGVSVNGIEQTLPLKVRFVEPQSPAAAQGVTRGDVIVSANGRTAAAIVAENKFLEFAAGQEGDTLTLVLENGGAQRTVALRAATFPLTPVTAQKVFALPHGGGKVGYLVLKDFVSQAEAPLAAALQDFRAQGATGLIVDLRYNGGGLVSTATRLASLITGSAHTGKAFVTLRHNRHHGGSDTTFGFGPAPGAQFQRVVVLTGARTCSASELVVNGLKPYLDVATVGGTTCGKPVGFAPRSSCGNVHSIVNFSSVNADGDGDYYNGISPTCPVADDFNLGLGDAAETLTAAALSYLEAGHCPAVTGPGTARVASASRPPSLLKRITEPGERNGMWVESPGH